MGNIDRTTMRYMKAINKKVRGRETAGTTAGGTVSESGCDGLRASTEPDEGCPRFTRGTSPL